MSASLTTERIFGGTLNDFSKNWGNSLKSMVLAYNPSIDYIYVYILKIFFNIRI